MLAVLKPALNQAESVMAIRKFFGLLVEEAEGVLNKAARASLTNDGSRLDALMALGKVNLLKDLSGKFDAIFENKGGA